MARLADIKFGVDLKLFKLEGTLSEDDRQCAWELYSELSTRVAVTGKPGDSDCNSFEGELFSESLDSLYRFFQESRSIMRKFPVGRIAVDTSNHLGVLVSRIMATALRPFLEKWHVRYRHWWENQSNPRLSPMERQKEFPDMKEFIDEWAELRRFMREFQQLLVKEYKLVDVSE